VKFFRAALPVVYLVLRYYAAFTLLGYGFAKIMGAQFTVLDSELAKPMGDVSGFWLTWYYFGYSPIYSNLIATFQIGGAILLCFGRTALLGALLLLPVMVNIIGVDLWIIHFPWSNGALRNAIYVSIALLVVILFHARDVWNLLFRNRKYAVAIFGGYRHWIVGLQICLVTAMVAYSAHRAYWIANVNNRAPTPIDGAWRVIQTEPALSNFPSWIYFEYNRAFMVVFRFPSGETAVHDFRVDGSQKTLTISEQWLWRGPELFKGRWERKGDLLKIKGTWLDGLEAGVVLERKPMRVKDHQ
jgi:hypothetical protein